MGRYEGPAFSGYDSRSSMRGNHQTIQKTRFPNYLENQEKRHELHQEEDHSGKTAAYISDDLMHAPADTVPFLRQNKDAFISYRDKAAVPAEDVFAAKKKHLQDEKRKEHRKQSDIHSYAAHKSRRPFQLTEIPEPLKGWINKNANKIDYAKIAGLLEKDNEDLLLFDAAVSEDAPHSEEAIVSNADGLHPRHGKAKRAMNRSLLGIMAQERSFDVSDKFTHDADGEAQPVGHSYFSSSR